MSPPAQPRLVLDRHARRYEDGRLLVGLRSGRLLRLSAAGRDALDQLLRGSEPSPAAERLADRVIVAGLAHRRPGPAAGAVDVTVVVPVRDRTAALDRLLAALGQRFPVIVVDDGSSDPVAVAEACASHGARLLRLSTCVGPAGARNAGVRQVASELVAFIDSDCLPPPGWIEALAAHLADPQLAAVAPRIVPVSSSASGTALARYTFARCPLDMGEESALVGPGQPVPYVPTAALLVRRAALGDGFDERLRHGEDVDALWRWCDAGWRVRYDPGVRIEHDEPSTWGGLLLRRFRYGTSAAPLAQRHPGRLAPITLPASTALAAGAALAGRRRLALASATWGGLRVCGQVRGRAVPPRLVAGWTARSLAQGAARTGRATTMLATPALLAGTLHRGTRLRALLLVIAPPLSTWSGHARALDPLRWVVASVADDVAYGAGVWVGSGSARSIGALRPTFVSGAADASSRRTPPHGSSIP